MNSSTAQHRQLFPALEGKVYFNYGGQGPLPTPALEAIIEAYKSIQQQGPFSNQVNELIKQKVISLKSAIALELSVTPDTITITENVTNGCNIVLWGINWQKGDHLLLTDCEHPGVIASILELSRRFELEVTTIPLESTLNLGDPLTTFKQYLKPNTRLVVLSHLLWNTGEVLPLREITELCHNHSTNLQILVDGAQSVGSLPLDLQQLKVDFYAFTGHKWLCGPEGVGGLYISPNALSTINPTFIGWRGVEIFKGYPQNWKPDGERFEVATSAFPLYEGLKIAINTHQNWGTTQARYQIICNNSHYLWNELAKVPQITCLKNTPPEAGLVSFKVKGSFTHEQLVKKLEQDRFYLRTIAATDCIRACVHYLTLKEEIDYLVECLKKSLN